MRIEEIQDILAEFENRLSTLENSISYSVDKPTKPQPPSRNLSPKEWGELQQLKSHLLFLQEKINNLEDKKRVDKQPKYTIN